MEPKPLTVISLDKPWCIYTLADPRNGKVRYVGKATRLSTRLADHLSRAKRIRGRNHRLAWLAGLLDAGCIPIPAILEEGKGPNWQEAEKRWIQYFRKQGAELTNMTDGGDWCANPSAELRAKRANAMRGRKASAITRVRLSISHKGKRQSPETIAKIKATMRNGGGITLAGRARIAAASRKRVWSIESRTKISVAKLGRKKAPHSEETKAKMSAAHRGRFWWNKLQQIGELLCYPSAS